MRDDLPSDEDFFDPRFSSDGHSYEHEERRKKRSLTDDTTTSAESVLSANTSTNDTRWFFQGQLVYEAAVVYGSNEIILTNLKHFQEYSIEVNGLHYFFYQY